MGSPQKTTQELVAEFCQQETIINSLAYIVDIDCFCMYQPGGYYKIISPEQNRDLKMLVYMYLTTHSKKNISDSLVEDFIKQLKYKLYRVFPSANQKYITLDSGKLYNIDTFEIETADYNKASFYRINCPPSLLNDPNPQPPPLFHKFLNHTITLPNKELLPDLELRELVQEMMGYYLINSLQAHATFFLVGTGQNGKSVLLDVLREMVGPEFSHAMSIETLTANRFAASGLIGKKINICLEEESTFIKSDRFKAMISGDPISIERKYGSNFLWQPTVKHIFATNEMPTFSGLNFGLIRRIKIIPFNRRITDIEKDPNLTKKLKQELPQILAWAIAGAKRLVANDFKFTQAKQSTEKIQEFQENISAASLFFNERYEPGSEIDFVSNEEMYEEYKIWGDSRGKKKQSYYVFVKDVTTFSGLPDVEGIVDGQKFKGKHCKYKQKSGKTQEQIPF